MTNLLFIYGRPAVGKLTVAREAATRTGFRLFHNHLIVDAALSAYDFGTPGFVKLRDALWRAALNQIARDPELHGVIFTFNPENSVPQAFIDDLFALFESQGARITCIELTCTEDEIERRLDSPSRHEHRKLTDAALYRTLRAQGVFESPVITRNRLVIDTQQTPPAEAAERIAASLRDSSR